MEKNLYGGSFIVFEGLDGSGQSTQAAFLVDYLKSRGRAVVATKEPTQWTRAGRQIGGVLGEKERTSPLKLQKLFCEDRREHLKREIIPALKRGQVVISDRYFFSTLAFGGLEVEMVKLARLNAKFLYPDKIFFLRVSPAECVRRIAARGAGAQFFEKLEKLKKVGGNYEKICARFPDVMIIDGEKTKVEIHQRIKSFFD